MGNVWGGYGGMWRKCLVSRARDTIKERFMADQKIDYTKVPSTKTMAGNTIWNLVGMGLPMVVGLFAFRLLTKGLAVGPVSFEGLDKGRFGALGLVWMFVGYFSIFDMGLGRALTKFVADKLSLDKRSELAGVFWTSIIMMLGFGFLATVVLAACSPALAGRWLKDVDDVLRPEIMKAFFVVSVGMPVVVMNVGLVGVLEACHKFKMINIIRIPAAVYSFVAPVCVLPYTNSLVVIVAVLLLGRVVEMFVYFAGCLVVLPELRTGVRWEKSEVSPLLRFGGWMTVSNMAVPLMTNVNRLLIGLIQSVGVGTFYLIPEEVVVRLFMFPKAWISVIFPPMVSAHARSKEELTRLFDRGVVYLMLAFFPVVMGLLLIAPEGLALWLGQEYADKGASVMRWLTVGVFVHGLGRVPWFMMQAVHKPSVVAKIHLIEIPLYFALAWFLIGRMGIKGAAIAWVARMVLDYIVMFLAAGKYLERAGRILAKIWIATAVAVVILIVSIWPEPFFLRIGTCVAGVSMFYLLSWLFVLSGSEKTELLFFINSKIRKSQ